VRENLDTAGDDCQPNFARGDDGAIPSKR
jgi:hypothetical protein